MRKGSYFFVLDVLLAGAIILTTLIVIQQAHVRTPQTRPTQAASDNLLTYLANTDVRDVQNALVEELIRNGTITDLQNTLLQEGIRLHYENQSLETQYYSSLSEILPKQIGIMIIINKTIVYNRSLEFMNTSNSLNARHTISYYPKNRTAIYGPVNVEVRTWD